MAGKLSAGTSGPYDLKQNSEINVTPFVDVMLVLLIIFMVAVPVTTVSMRADLPPVDIDNKAAKDPTYVSVSASGVAIVDSPTTLAALAGDLARRLNVARPTEETIMIRADADVRYEQFMHVMNTLQDAGYYKVGLISEELV